MSATERIQKFFEDGERLLSSGTSTNVVKIVVEINKLKTWIQKHQQESVAEAAKGKLYQTLMVYNRLYQIADKASSGYGSLGESLEGLLSDYLQMPEGKLVTSKDKKKVMSLLQSISPNLRTTVDNFDIKSCAVRSKWIVQDINEENHSLVLLNTEDEEKWLEEVVVNNNDIWTRIVNLMKLDTAESVCVIYNESGSSIEDIITS